ncbi:DNA phosphorothioation-associated putative methyltransferase [Thalassomonas haliotis]|uniref:DNA phosphorothioation-associated putative methyltransferase n=1 Tax=Thalassomonas haliotis TaxID=485448 RepID=A0ABY7VKH0_9GAMM|nr:DNA phosphorothioation-associated putative methyltransferase [Thalassomonas haliotis]WDE13495.1 DNA phosphorothioation-associated putative methyltransferase [Thalassomonas haliotis]
MDFVHYRELIKTIKQGKHLPTAIYLHKSAIEAILPEKIITLINSTISTLTISSNWNLIKLYKRDFKITLLNYPDFDSYAYPALQHSTTIDLQEQTYRTANYEKSENPPILHRKETLVLTNHPLVESFQAITAEGEAINLYQNTKNIGFKQQWRRLIKRKGYQLDDAGRLKPLATLTATPKTATSNNTKDIQRHLTAINRDRLSAPFQKLARHGYLAGEHSIFDYGCGKGDDIKELEAHGLNVTGWDPVHKPEGEKTPSDIVNLGFVLNVIEIPEERQTTLTNAWELTKRILMVSVMLANEAKQEQFTRYKDGIITKWNTFQKYYSQAELRSYLEQVLNTNTVALGQGIFAIFKDKNLEEEFYLNRQTLPNSQQLPWQQLTTRATQSPAASNQNKALTKSLYEKHSELFNDFWQHCLELGRIPANDEFECSEPIRRLVGSHKKAFELMQNQAEPNEYQQAQQQRRIQVLVYFALSLFEKRKAKSHIPARLQRDLKALFTTYTDTIEQAKALLFSVGKPATLTDACNLAYQQFNCGKLADSHSYTFNRELLNQMPAEIRVYVGCAVQLYGDLDEINLIKVHIRSGKVTLLKYDDFQHKALPLLIERIKIRLHDLDIDFFNYGEEYPYQPLYDKSRYLIPASAEYKKQQAFEKRIAKMLEGVPKEEWPNWHILQRVFEYKKVQLKGNKFYST